MSVAIGRYLEYADGFAGNLQSFAKRKRDPGLPKRVHQALASRLEQGPGNDPRLKKIKGLPVFKMRVPAQGRGKRGGARVIYYHDHERLLALSIFLKCEKADMSPADRKQIKNALHDAGLWPEEPP